MNLQNLYQHLMVNRKYQLQEWHDKYEIMRKAIKTIRKQFESDTTNNKSLQDIDYSDDSIKSLVKIAGTEVNDCNSLLRILFYDEDNGISGNGQSVLSKENLPKLQKDPNFLDLIKQVILSNDSNLISLSNSEEMIASGFPL